MSLHPQARAMIEAMTAGASLDFTTLTAAEFRAAFAVPAPSMQPEPTVSIRTRTLDTKAGSLRARLYYPRGNGPFPITLYLHGGGFVIGDPSMTDGICASLAHSSGSLFVSVDYRLAPESLFPAGVDDAWAALDWLHRHGAVLDGDAARLAVAGDSSGGNFAAVVAQQARDAGIRLRHQLLLYPVLDCCFTTGSYRSYGSGYFLTATLMQWYWQQYLGDLSLAAHVRASPSRRENLAGVASATIVTAEYDVLRDEGESYASALASAGVAVTLRRWQGQIHGFLLMQGSIDDAGTALLHAGRTLRQALL